MLHKIAFAVLVAGYAAVSAAIAGSAQTKLTCTSTDGKLSITGLVPPDALEIDIVLSNEGKRARVLRQSEDDSGPRVSVVHDLPQGVYTLQVHTGSLSLTLYAVPKSVVAKKIPNGLTASFDAKVSLYGSSVGASTASNRVVKCSTRYEI